MDDFKDLTISVPADVAEIIRTKVEAGEYASEGDVVCQALQSLQAQDLRAERLSAIRSKLAAALADTGPSYTSQEMADFFNAQYQRAVVDRVAGG